MVEALPHRPAGMDQGELLVAIAGLLDQRRLQRVEDHAQRGGAGGALGVVLVRLAVHMLHQHGVRAQRQRRFGVFRDGDHGHALALADVQDRQQLLGLSTAGGEDHHVPGLQESRGAMHGLRGRDKAGGPLDAAQQMRDVLADDARVSAARGADAGRGS